MISTKKLQPIEQANNRRNHNQGGFMKMYEKVEEA
jgi:hypothetical protein